MRISFQLSRDTEIISLKWIITTGEPVHNNVDKPPEKVSANRLPLSSQQTFARRKKATASKGISTDCPEKIPN